MQSQSAISPDATHIASGSSDGNAYVWQVTLLTLDDLSISLELRSELGYDLIEVLQFRLTSLKKNLSL